ncbi:hypothetical protein [Synechococcus elongatus]|uniref:Uncharacterized protein n=1 Tax=Synechococcus elongatus PCC 11801 TaxID=2219813 RepID=A0AAN1UU03_SYNEL|nr:hypothetical protein [Synechococcus elongatus]AZB72113.1 hypothetical protein DOP62_04650 [Synechococcus elongatus PCC 11801]
MRSSSHVQFIYSFDQARFLFLATSLAQEIVQANQQQAGCAHEHWQSLPELAHHRLLARPQAAVLDWQNRPQSWGGWLLGVDWQEHQPSRNAAEWVS